MGVEKRLSPDAFLGEPAARAGRKLTPDEFLAAPPETASREPAASEAVRPPVDFPDAQPRPATPPDRTFGDAVAEAASELWGQGFEKPLQDVLAGYRAGASRMYTTGANAAMLVNRVSQKLAELSGYEGQTDTGDSYAEQVEAWLRRAAREVAPDQEDVSADLPGMIYQGLGQAPVAMTEYLLGGRAVGTVPGMAGVEALSSLRIWSLTIMAMVLR